MAHALMLTQEYVIKNMFLDGQIENWVVIVDMAGTGLSSVPKAELQGIAEILGKNYLGRLGRVWMVNTSWMTKILWGIISSFLDKVTIDKVHLTDKNFHPDMKKYFQPGQLLKRFGGEAEAPPSNWPPYVPQTQCSKEESNLLSEEEYLKVLEIRPLLQKRPDLIKKEEAQFEEVKQEEVVLDFPNKHAKTLETEDLEADIESLMEQESIFVPDFNRKTQFKEKEEKEEKEKKEEKEEKKVVTFKEKPELIEASFESNSPEEVPGNVQEKEPNLPESN